LTRLVSGSMLGFRQKSEVCWDEWAASCAENGIEENPLSYYYAPRGLPFDLNMTVPTGAAFDKGR